MSTKQFFHATKVVFGAGTVGSVGEEAALLGASKVLIVTDGFLAKSSILEKVKDSLESANIQYAIYSHVKPNPRDGDCVIAAELAKKEKADIIIGLGGGSSMDQAKATAALVTNGGTCKDWDGIDLEKKMLPVICIPTTAGTGSEVTFVAVITDTERHFKMSVFDPLKLVPSVAIADPELTLTLPSSLTASTGIDAITHAIEAYTCKVSQPITDGLALQAIKLLSQNIVAAVEDGSNLETRSNMMIGSLMAGIAFINANVGAVHAISETIGGWYDTPHGIGNSIFLPYVMEYNLEGNEEKFADVAIALGIESTGKTKKDLAEAAVGKIKALNDMVKIPKLKDLGYIKEENFEAIAETSAANLLSQDNAREITKEGYLNILKKAFQNA